jgi:hypothetical protein
MMSATKTETSVEAVETLLREELAQGDAMLSTATPILRHLLANDDQALFSDEVVARVRGMVSDIARQLLHAQAEAAAVVDHTAFLAEREERLAALLIEEPSLLAHVHALTIEAKLALQLQLRSNIDPVLSPLLQDLVASKDDFAAGSAMAVIAAQARFIQQHRRTALPVGELPGELFHRALLAFRSQAGESDHAAAAAENALRGCYDEAHSRLGLISRLVMRLGKTAPSALDLDNSGLAVFTTALAMSSNQERSLTVLSFSDRQFARLSLALRAAGLREDALEEQLLFLHPGIGLPEGFENLSADRASLLLASSSPRDA